MFGCSPIGVAIRATASGFASPHSEEPGSAAAGRQTAPERDEASRAADRREADKAAVDFRSLGLSAATLAAVERAGYEIPTPVQAGLIPRAVLGVDVLGQARTGTGKTASFVLPILERMAKPGRGGSPRALVLVPTRELAVQVKDEFEKLVIGQGLGTGLYEAGAQASPVVFDVRWQPPLRQW